MEYTEAAQGAAGAGTARPHEPRFETRRAERTRNGARRDVDGGPERLARALGWFSIGLGLAEVVAPRRVARLIGIADNPTRRRLLRVMGLREITSGAGILSGRRTDRWLWSRVGGDALDLGFLGRAFDLPETARGRLATAGAAVAGVTALDVMASERLSRRTRPGIHVRQSFTLNRPVEEVYGFWRRLENLPRFMRHLESVEVLDDRRSRWRAKAPAGTTVEWEAEIVADEPGRRLAWRSVEGATVPNQGTVRFVPAPAGRGTEIHVELEYQPPAGAVGAAVAKLFGEEPSLQVREDLRRLKQLLEAGEPISAKGPAARRRPSLFGQ
jgi:uncharacterized membrane protein